MQLIEPELWQPHLAAIERLLRWISNDTWTITVSQDGLERPQLVPNGSSNFEKVALFSGGLDSFCGAVLNEKRTLFLAHTDSNTVTGSQTRAWDWLRENELVDGEMIRIRLRERSMKGERSTRTRAFLFYSLAIAAADAHDISLIEIPENGFTSLNVPLGNDRGGVLSTRSTHPWTIAQLRELVSAASIDVGISNPYEFMTKGDLVDAAATRFPALAEGAALTLSCAKLDARFYGGNPDSNCGLCVACLTRRGGILASRIDDESGYVADAISGHHQDRLLKTRDGDLKAVFAGLSKEIDEFTLIGLSQFPNDYDFTTAVDLARRGFVELAELMETLA